MSKYISRAGGNVFISNDHPNPMQNGTIHSIIKITTNVMASAEEAGIGAALINTQGDVPICQTSIEPGHNQPSTGTFL